MAYLVVLSDGTKSILIPPEQVTTNLASIPLVGRNYQGYGDEIATALLRSLENFANNTSPPVPLVGQLWYDTDNNTLKVYDDTIAGAPWRPVAANQLNDLLDVSVPQPQNNQVLTYVVAQNRWEARVPQAPTTFLELSDTPLAYQSNRFLRVNATGDRVVFTSNIPGSAIAGAIPEASVPNLPASKITSGLFNIARIPNIPASKVTGVLSVTANIPDLPASKITSGTFANARISQVSVTQHQGALSINYSQLTNVPSIDVPRAATSTSTGSVLYNGTTDTLAGAFYGGGSTVNPTTTTRLNYNGNLHANSFVSVGSINAGNGLTVVGGNLAVSSGNSTVNGNSTVSGNSTVGGNLSVTGTATVTGTLAASQNVSVGNNLTVANDLTVGNNLNITNLLANAGTTASPNGYVTLPGGLIMQWGRAPVTGSGSSSSTVPNPVTLNIPFPSNVVSVTASPEGNASASTRTGWSVRNIGLNGFEIITAQQFGPGGVAFFRWLAIGY